MKSFTTSIKDRLKSLDYIVFSSAALLSLISIITLYGAREYYRLSYAMVQAAATGLGIFMMLFISQLDYQDIVDKLALPLFIVSIGLLSLTLVIGTFGEYGSKSWLTFSWLPFNIQPSEFVKLFLIITFSKHLDLLKDKINHPAALLQLGLHAGIIVALVLLQGDLGTVLVYVAILAGMLYAAGLSLWYYAGAAAVAVISAPYVWPLLKDYQQLRILSGFNPELDPDKYGFQALMSKQAIIQGRIWGEGLNGGSAYADVPMVHSDFFFAMVCNKFGFIGAVVVLSLLSVLIIRILVIARGARKDSSAFICVGIAMVLIAQTAENVGMCLAMLPVIGITLPFLSYGGSSTLSLYLMLGIIQSVYTHRVKYHFEREAA